MLSRVFSSSPYVIEHYVNDPPLFHFVKVLSLCPAAADGVMVVLVQRREVDANLLDVGLAEGDKEAEVEKQKAKFERGRRGCRGCRASAEKNVGRTRLLMWC
jgi:hypothetical protein